MHDYFNYHFIIIETEILIGYIQIKRLQILRLPQKISRSLYFNFCPNIDLQLDLQMNISKTPLFSEFTKARC